MKPNKQTKLQDTSVVVHKKSSHRIVKIVSWRPPKHKKTFVRTKLEKLISQHAQNQATPKHSMTKKTCELAYKHGMKILLRIIGHLPVR